LRAKLEGILIASFVKIFFKRGMWERKLYEDIFEQ
jgi:hypothetical protein